MTLFENINIRLFDPKKNDQIQLMFERIKGGLGQGAQPHAVSLLHSCSLPGDWTIQLEWRGNDMPRAKTALGRHLAESIRDNAMVHHTLWQTHSTITIDRKP